MKFLSLIVRNCVQTYYFGSIFFFRHFANILSFKTITIPAWGIGIITLRPGNSDAATFHQVFIDKTYDCAQFPQYDRAMLAYHACLKNDKKPLIIDAGANVGAASLWFAKQFPEALIIAIEPDPRSAKICRKNIANYANIQLIEAAIGAEEGQVTLTCTDKGWETQCERHHEGDVKVVTINALIEAQKNANLFLVKIDIEGFESDLFTQNLEWLNQASVIMIEPHDWLLPAKYTSQSMLKAVSSIQSEVLISGDTLLFIK